MTEDSISIGVASERTGLTQRQIRYLEDRGYVVPEYIQIGNSRQRRYPEELVERLAEIARLRDEGYTLETAVALSGRK